MTLKEIRQEAGLTQKALADKSGISWRNLQRYENGELSIDSMTTKTALALIRALGMTADEFIKKWMYKEERNQRKVPLLFMKI